MKFRCIAIMIIGVALSALAVGCDNFKNNPSPKTINPVESTVSTVYKDSSYKKISSQDAKNIMLQNKEAILLDVRTAAENEIKRIPGSTLIPVDEITSKAESTLKNKDATILVYCRSGNRSKTASNELIKLGYKNVYDFGGINDWNYETESGVAK